MAKYEIGDKFQVEIVDVDESGMGVAYTLSNDMIVTDAHLDKSIMIWTNEPLSEEVKEDKSEKKTYTPEDLLERISRANVILGELIKTYVEATQTINHIPAIDERLEELSL